MLALTNTDGAVLLERRPPTGIWGGLWSLPEIAALDDLSGCLESAGLAGVDDPYSAARLRHTFSHYHLDIDVQALSVSVSNARILEAAERVWYKGGPAPGGMAAPVSKILKALVGE